MSEPRTAAGLTLNAYLTGKGDYEPFAADIAAIEEQAATEARRELLAALQAIEFVHGVCPACSVTERPHLEDCSTGNILGDSA